MEDLIPADSVKINLMLTVDRLLEELANSSPSGVRWWR